MTAPETDLEPSRPRGILPVFLATSEADDTGEELRYASIKPQTQCLDLVSGTWRSLAPGLEARFLICKMGTIIKRT